MTHPTRIALLDLDGTLTESHMGIQESAKIAYRHFNKMFPAQTEFDTFIGPPLYDSFISHGFSTPEEANEAVNIYRKAYTTPTFENPNKGGELLPGMFLNNMYEGILSALDDMKKEGYILALATCKPEPQAKRINDYFGFSKTIDYVFGASLDNSRIHKDQIISYALKNLDFDSSQDKAVMVGDRGTDVTAAHKFQIPCIGVKWGYAQPSELEDVESEMIIDSVSQLPEAVKKFL